MDLPKIDFASLPDLSMLTGPFGSLVGSRTPGHDDSIVLLATFIYEVQPPGGGLA